MRIGVISDTHGMLREEVKTRLSGCDCILHAGDFANESVFSALSALGKPFYAVCGNNDFGSWSARLPELLDITLDGVRIYMAHRERSIPWRLDGADAVIFGHSHQYFEEYVDGRLWLNPGTCGRPRFANSVTMAIMTIENGKVSVERIDLDPAKP